MAAKPDGFWTTTEHRVFTKSVCDILCKEAARQGIASKAVDDQCCTIGGQSIYVENIATEEFSYSTHIIVGFVTFTAIGLEEVVTLTPEIVRGIQR